MSVRGETGWQAEKTVAECNRYMLDNEIATDVCFEVGPPDGDIVKIKAHKYVLISRSPVFEAMFCSGMAEIRNDPKSTIRVEDIEARHFKEMLIFMYCGHSDIEVEKVPALLYVANKYMLKGLHQLCSQLIQNNLDEDTVCSALELSFQYEDKSLEDKCLQFISDNSEGLLARDKIQSLSRRGMEAVVKLERIASSESTVYRACIAWAKHQLIKQEIQTPTDKEIRKTLGCIIHEIRFPIMGNTEFAKLVGTGDILTNKEKSTTYYYYATKDITDKLVFNTRGRQEFVINRFDTVNDSPMGKQCNSCKLITFSFHAIEFEADRDIILTGLGFYAGFQNRDYEVALEIKDANRMQTGGTEPDYKEQFVVRARKDSNIVKRRLLAPLHIRSGVRWVITALVKGNIGHVGCKKTTTVSASGGAVRASSRSATFGMMTVPTFGGESRLVSVSSREANVTFNFYNCNASSYANSTSHVEGQFPQMYFMLPD